MAPAPITGDPRFFAQSGPQTLARVADEVGGTLVGGAPGHLMLVGVAPLQAARPDQVSFLDNKRYASALAASAAGAVILHPDMQRHLPPGTVGILTPEPYLGWARVAALFHPEKPANPGIHPSACVAPDAEIGEGCEIGPMVVIGAGARIGPRCRIGAQTVIGPSVQIGADARIDCHVSLSHALLGDRVRLLPGVRIGQDGFGFAMGAQGFVSVPQLGRVVIEDDVDIGANTTIDRGSAQDTVVGAGTRIDNLVQIAHNVQIGRCCVIVAQVGISGSAILEDFVMLGGQAGVVGHARLGRRARIGAQAGVISDVEAGAEFVGSPAQNSWDFFRQLAYLRRATREQPARRPPGGAADEH